MKSGRSPIKAILPPRKQNSQDMSPHLHTRGLNTDPGRATFDSATVPIVSSMIVGSLIFVFTVYFFIRRHKNKKQKQYFDKRRSLRELNRRSLSESVLKSGAGLADAQNGQKKANGLDSATSAAAAGNVAAIEKSKGNGSTGIGVMHGSMVKPPEPYKSSNLRNVETWISNSQESLRQPTKTTTTVGVTTPAPMHKPSKARLKTRNLPVDADLEQQLGEARSMRDKSASESRSGFFEVEKDGRDRRHRTTLEIEPGGGDTSPRRAYFEAKEKESEGPSSSGPRARLNEI